MSPAEDFSRVESAPRSDDQSLIDGLALDLASAGYRHDAVVDLLGPQAHAALVRDQTVPAALAVQAALDAPAAPEEAALAGTVAFFLLGEALAPGDLDRFLPRTGAAGLSALGLAEDAPGGGLRAAVDLRPHASDADAELWVASDLAAHQRPGPLRRDHVLGIGQASLTLAQTTVRRPAGRALDLGTGCGIQTFHLLAHCRRVVATDLSERALAFTRFNLLLNRAALGLDPDRLSERVELRRGSLLEPVAGESFDLVVSNPPFVITPRRAGESAGDRYTYRDGGMPGDALVAGLVAGLPGVLAPGGTAQLLANWEIRAGADWAEGPRSWVPDGTDAWVIQRETETPAEYAETWLRDAAESRDPGHYRLRYADYLADFASRGVSAVGFGYLWLRRPAGPSGVGVRIEEIAHAVEQPLGPHLGAAVAAADALAGADLPALRLTVPDDVTEERHARPGAEHPAVILLRQGAGLRRSVLLSTEEAGFVSACDGTLTAGQIAAALAALLGTDPAECAERLMASVVRLVTDGFLRVVRNNS